MNCKDYAVKILSIKDRTEKELRDKLREKKYPEDEIDGAVEDMKGYGYIDDARYAARFAADGFNLRGHGSARIKTDLIKKGVSRDIVDSVLEQNQTDPRERIREVLKVRFSSADLSNPKERNRILGFFSRRGYSYRDVIGVINDICAFENIDFEE